MKTVTVEHDIRDVELSGFHANQICQPVLTEQVIRGSTNRPETAVIEAKWYWVDLSIGRDEPGREYAHGSCRGLVRTVRAAVRQAGIRVDDSRSMI